MAHYLAHSEQTPAAVALGVLVEPDTRIRAAGGWMVTPLPGASPDLLGELEARLKQAPQVSRAIDALGKGAQESPAVLLEELLAPWRPRILAEQPVAFHCSCSRSRFEAGLVALGPKELLDIAREQDPVELRCRFCGRRYLFSAERIRQLAVRAAGPRLRVVKGTGASTS
ncbi:MAG: Hsp33 family molecular chaperone HslO [Limnochordaceae bacterium]|nr:Hsp33 family molecular chaperone HslO [Limnochordaceae bacterium]